MAKIGVLHFYPERIAWLGLTALGAVTLLAFPFFISLYVSRPLSVAVNGALPRSAVPEPMTFSLGLSEKSPTLPIPDLQGEMTFSFDPPRPIDSVDRKMLLVRIKKSSESKRVVLPCRIDLEFQGNQLRFAKGLSSFWIELAITPAGQIEGKGFITSLDGERVDAGSFIAPGQDCPVQGAQEFAEGSPFRVLAEARWWGRDLFREVVDSGERLEIGNQELLELKADEWLVWKDQKWQKGQALGQESAIAHIQSHAGKSLILEGWDNDGHIRISLNPAAGPPFRTKGEDLFSSVRMRSEKQISCMLEKQCMILKPGDWVLKTGGKWKVLKRKEEREAVINGKLFGELFVFDQISQKQGQKMIVGKLFNPGRTQVVPIEMSAQSTRKTAGKEPRKGRAQ